MQMQKNKKKKYDKDNLKFVRELFEAQTPSALARVRYS